MLVSSLSEVVSGLWSWVLQDNSASNSGLAQRAARSLPRPFSRSVRVRVSKDQAINHVILRLTPTICGA